MGEFGKRDTVAATLCLDGKMIAKTTYTLCNPTANCGHVTNAPCKPLNINRFFGRF
jgi:hypothetical protein